MRHHLDTDGGYLDPRRHRRVRSSRRPRRRLLHLRSEARSWTSSSRRCSTSASTPARILIERFVSQSQSPARCRRAADARIETPARTDAPESVTIILKGKRSTVAYQPGDTVLETARRGGLQPPFSCEAGNCATCMALLHEGSVTMRANNALDPDEVEEGWILTCQAVPEGPTVTVEYEAPF